MTGRLRNTGYRSPSRWYRVLWTRADNEVLTFALSTSRRAWRRCRELGMDSTPRSSANKLIAVSIRNVDELGTDVRDKESPAGPAESPTATNMELIITPTSATSSTATGLATRVPKDGDTGRGGGAIMLPPGANSRMAALATSIVPRSAAKTYGAALVIS